MRLSKKLKVAVLFGGQSGEHEVSIQSACSVIESMNPDKFEIIPVAITHEGGWKGGSDSLALLRKSLRHDILDRLVSEERLALVDRLTSNQVLDLIGQRKGLPVVAMREVDVIFPVLHGTYGEDGTIQGLLELAGKPYVGAGVLASSVGMDKVMMKQIFAQTGLPQGDFTFVLRRHWEQEAEQIIERIESRFTYPCFVKPSNLGSSVGISKVKDRDTLCEAIDLACHYDRKVLIEEFIPAREVEVAVLGNDEPKASVPGEIIASNEFYDYRAKYIDGKSVIQIPADLPNETTELLRKWAVKAFQAVDGSGLARIDFFVRTDNGKVLINEINTMPGFTAYSMYPKLWEYSGLSYSALVEKLIELAFDRYREKSRNATKFDLES